ncbi:MAG: class I SAM-dependent methyltransferase [bacterium]|nr:class I SAM-dependent methyltransferase [bacterium]
MPMNHHREDNRANWDGRVDGHIDGYRVDRYIDDPNHMSDVVMFDIDRLDDLAGTTALHLQCHIGTDTITLARLGAEVTGIDFAPKAIAAAQDMFAKAGNAGRFIVSELYDAPQALDEQFDMVYTGVGALIWLSDIDGWAGVVDHFVKPGGRLFITEGHPAAWALDQDREDRLLVMDFPYFETVEPQTWNEATSYLGDATLTATTSHEWNHGLGEIFTALLNRGFVIKTFVEHRVLPWKMHSWMEEAPEGWFQFPESVRDKVPLMYTLVAEKLSS